MYGLGWGKQVGLHILIMIIGIPDILGEVFQASETQSEIDSGRTESL